MWNGLLRKSTSVQQSTAEHVSLTTQVVVEVKGLVGTSNEQSEGRKLNLMHMVLKSGIH